MLVGGSISRNLNGQHRQLFLRVFWAKEICQDQGFLSQLRISFEKVRKIPERRGLYFGRAVGRDPGQGDCGGYG